MHSRILVTAGLPYANGSLHMGHLVEYCQADIYVRALKRLGHDACFICADDAHGTPIEINASRLNIKPEELVQRYHQEHQRDFALFDIAFDHYSITHSETNRRIVEHIYQTLKDKQEIEERQVDGNYCEHDKRFLPDRFIKGTCPKCSTADQYGDVCEHCGATYAATDLLKPFCVLCGNTPVIKQSQHLFFTLSNPKHSEFLKAFIDSRALQPDIANFVRHWLELGLKDWCISRDGPYFGFAIPGKTDKFFYVWLDAPIGYIAASVEWGEKHNLTLQDLWQTKNTRIEHIIGKDIVYFHTLFWPAVLKSIGYTLPSKVHVHGMLTINGEKMSKSRGTFINAATFAKYVDPQALRYYYASKLSSNSDDLDLSLDDFVFRVNGELVNKHANLFSRVAQFLEQKLDSQLGDLPFTAADAQKVACGDGSMLDLAQQVVVYAKQIEVLYAQREFAQAVRLINSIADLGNEFMQNQKPWDQLKTDKEQARLTCTFVTNVCYALAMYLWPIIPKFAEACASILNRDITRMSSELLFQERSRSIGKMQRLFDRLERKSLDAMIEIPVEAAPEKSAITIDSALIDYTEFSKLDLRVGKVISAEPVPKSKKLLRLMVDLGEQNPRQIISGLAPTYSPEQLVGTNVVVVANLKPAKLMGLESQGMILAAGDNETLAVLRLDKDLPPGTIAK